MGTVTASLERSLQNCTLNNRDSGIGRSDSSPLLATHNNKTSSSSNDNSNSESDSDSNSTLIQLNSHLPLPYHWEQCLDLKTGELYYINWRIGTKAKEDPRTTSAGYNGDYDSEEEEDSSPYDGEGSLTESSSCTSFRSVKNGRNRQVIRGEAVLVVAGCKSCLMYHMVRKQVDECPKCSGQLLHFPANNSSSSSP